MGDSTTRDGQTAAARTRASDQARASAQGDRSAFDFNKKQGEESIPELLHELAGHVSDLAQEQTRLARAEIHSAIAQLEESVAAMVGAAVVGMAGLGVSLMAVAYLLGSAMPLWLGTLIVGVVALGVAYALFAGAKSKLQSSSVAMRRSRHTIERAPSAVSGKESEVRHGR